MKCSYGLPRGGGPAGSSWQAIAAPLPDGFYPRAKGPGGTSTSCPVNSSGRPSDLRETPLVTFPTRPPSRWQPAGRIEQHATIMSAHTAEQIISVVTVDTADCPQPWPSPKVVAVQDCDGAAPGAAAGVVRPTAVGHAAG
jgi:hypothetical protein